MLLIYIGWYWSYRCMSHSLCGLLLFVHLEFNIFCYLIILRLSQWTHRTIKWIRAPHWWIYWVVCSFYLDNVHENQNMHNESLQFFYYYSHSYLKPLILFLFLLFWWGTRNFELIFSMSLIICLINWIRLYFSKNDLLTYLIYEAWMLCSFIILIFEVILL